MSDRILLVGGGGREDSIARRIVESGSELYTFLKQRNPSIVSMARKFRIGSETVPSPIVEFALENRVDLAFIGPDPVLETTLVEDLRKKGIKVASPDRSAARIETDKRFMRDLLHRFHVRGSVPYEVFTSEPDLRKFLMENREKEYAVKPIGLTGGKGVKVMGIHLNSMEEAAEYGDSVIRKDGSVLLEERITGEEFSLQVFTDGHRVSPMPVVQDYKRAMEGDIGPNTGGMGSISDSDHSLPFLRKGSRDDALSIMGEVNRSLERSGNLFRGVLYGQFMDTADGVKIVEINARFADPESINVLHLLEDDFTGILHQIADGNLRETHRFRKSATVLKYVVPSGYGTRPEPGVLKIGELNEKERRGIYYAAVSGDLHRVEQSTSRSLAVIGEGESIFEANDQCENLLRKIDGKFYVRHDIGSKSMIESKVRALIT